MIAARWIRIGPADGLELQALCSDLAAAQGARAAPILLWSQEVMALIVPLRLAPGLRRRWIPWALAPAIAAYRGCGVAAYLEGRELRLAGRKIASASCARIGGCAVIASSFLHPVPDDRFRALVEAQYGWQFETSWPSTAERRHRAVHCADSLAPW